MAFLFPARDRFADLFDKYSLPLRVFLARTKAQLHSYHNEYACRERLSIDEC